MSFFLIFHIQVHIVSKEINCTNCSVNLLIEWSEGAVYDILHGPYSPLLLFTHELLSLITFHTLKIYNIVLM